MDESLAPPLSKTTNKGNDRNRASSKEEFHYNNYRQITNVMSDAKSA